MPMVCSQPFVQLYPFSVRGNIYFVQGQTLEVGGPSHHTPFRFCSRSLTQYPFSDQS
jgi:hypothetical protein